MLRTRLLLALFVLAACGASLPQGGLRQPTQSRLRIIVTYEDGRTRVRDATVEVMDAVGGSSAMSQKLTDQDGQVDFSSWSGLHRIRVTGADIRPHEGEFEIAPEESFHLEYVSVQRKTGDQGSTPAPEGQSTIPAIRLKVPPQAREEFQKGSEALKQQQWESGRKYFQAAVDLYPDYDMAYNGLGMACWQLNDVACARAALLKATQLNENFAEAQRNLARILLRERDFEGLAAHLNLSLKVEPKNAWALSNAAYAELQLNRFREAAEHAQRVHGMPHEKLAWAHMVAGYALEGLGQKQQAAAEFKLYLKEDPKGSDVKHAQEALARLAGSPQP